MSYLWCFIALLLSSCAGTPSLAQENPPHPTESRGTPAVVRSPSVPGGSQERTHAEDQVIVQFVKCTSRAAVESMAGEFHLEIIRVFSDSDLYLMRIRNHTPMETILERLKRHPSVRHAEPNFKFKVD